MQIFTTLIITKLLVL